MMLGALGKSGKVKAEAMRKPRVLPALPVSFRSYACMQPTSASVMSAQDNEKRAA
jgi:hypothetical protein